MSVGLCRKIMGLIIALEVSSVAFGDDIPGTKNGIPDVSNGASKGGMYIGAGMGFGQSYVTKGDSSPGLAIDIDLEPGFTFQTGSWSRVEASAEFYTVHFGYRLTSSSKTRVSVSGFGLMPKFGYGYSLGDGLYAVWGIGVGPAFANFSASAEGDVSAKSSGTVGLSARGFAEVVAPASDAIDLIAGVKYTHYEIDPGEVKISTPVGSSTVHDYESVVVNVPEINLGIRLKL